MRRCEWYVANGVVLALLLDYRDETVRVFRPDRPVPIARGDDHIHLHEIAPGVSLVVADIFAALIIE